MRREEKQKNTFARLTHLRAKKSDHNLKCARLQLKAYKLSSPENTDSRLQALKREYSELLMDKMTAKLLGAGFKKDNILDFYLKKDAFSCMELSFFCHQGYGEFNIRIQYNSSESNSYYHSNVSMVVKTVKQLEFCISLAEGLSKNCEPGDLQ